MTSAILSEHIVFSLGCKDSELSSNRLNEMQERGERIVLPSMEVARTFSVETIDFPHPLGVHQVHRWLGAGLVPLDEWCPEYKLCSEDHVIDA